MKEFLVELTVAIPEGTDPAEVGRRRAEESVEAGESVAAGHLVRLWRPVGELRSIGLWRAADEGESGSSLVCQAVSQYGADPRRVPNTFS
ncbi:muconolactone Delta-isomerase family protein [Streptomyces sp. NPDC056231]|uniref:muconolactone Delta-isomerase family protein n=1 Tax=unclassified Streptomyces TaxID=2593676 RepID=UPI0033EDEF4A